MDSLHIQQIGDHARGDWDAALAALPGGHFLQSWEWGELKAQYGWRAQRYVCERNGRPASAFTLLTRSLPRLPWRVAYVPKGPLLDFGDPSRFSAALDAIALVARDARVVYVKTDPDLSADDSAAAAVYGESNWSASTEQIQFPNTALLDLAGGEDAVLAAMKSKTRYNIRLASRRGVAIEQTTDWDILYRLYAETAARDGFAIREAGYYHALWSAFSRCGRGEAFLAKVGEDAVAGLYLMHYGDTGWFFTGASTHRHRKMMPNYLLQWHTMQWLMAHGYRWYDLWGAPTVLDESDPLWGVYRFKQGFGAQYVRRLGAYDRVFNRPVYALLTRFVPYYWRLRHGLARRTRPNGHSA